MRSHRAILLWTLTLLFLGGFFAAAFQQGARAAPLKNPAQGNIVISELRTRGEGGLYDEFIELFNPTGNSIDIGGWIISRSSSCGIDTFNLFTIPAPTILVPGQHYLVGSVNATNLQADQIYLSNSSSSISDNGGVALLDPDLSLPVDSVGMCSTTQYVEGTSLAPLTTDLNRSYERLPGGESGNCTDSDNNAVDFHIHNTSSPQNSTSSLTTACTPLLPTSTSTFTLSTTASLSSTPSFTASRTSTHTNTLPSGTISPSTPTLTASRTLTATSTGPAITLTPTITPHLVISEFRSRGPAGVDDEFVELYNPTGGAVNIGTWTIRRSVSCGSTVLNLVAISSGVILLPGQHYLMISNTNSTLTDADQIFAPGIADDGGIALFNANNAAVDQVGMCATTAYLEVAPLVPLSGTANQSYERRAGGSTSCIDNNNNGGDFQLISPPNPQNRASPIVMCSGVLTYTPTSTFTITRTPTRTPTPIQTIFPGNVVLNEYLPHPVSDWNEDGEVNNRDEYIELINMGTSEISIQGWLLDDIANGGSTPYPLPDITLIQYQIVRFFASETGISLSDGGDSVRLIKPDGRTADLQNYTVVTAFDRTWCRLPDGNGVWGFVCWPTPGRPNSMAAAETPAPEEEPPKVPFNCLLPDTAPRAFWLAECSSSGGNLWERKADREFWLQNRWKWDVFME